jgi:hypothetical protein
MLRVLLYVALLATLFVGAVLWAGNAIGAWEPPVLPTPPTSASTETTKTKKDPHSEHHNEAPAKPSKRG